MPKQTQMTKQDIFSTVQACEYLGMSVTLLRYHVYETGHLEPDLKIANALAFYKSTLDEFKANYQMEGYTLKEAATYLGVSMNWVRHHVFDTKLLVADGKRGAKAIFSKTTLDAMKGVIKQEEKEKVTA